MISVGETIRVNLRRGSIKDELMSCEWGSYEDHIRNVTCDRCNGSGLRCMQTCGLCKGKGTVVERLEPYHEGRLHVVELILRDKSKACVDLHTPTEIQEFFRGACTGTFGLRHLSSLRRIYKQLAPFVDADTKRQIPYNTLGY